MPARVLWLGEKINGGGSSKRNPDHHRKLPSVCHVLLKCVLGENEARGNAALCSLAAAWGGLWGGTLGVQRAKRRHCVLQRCWILVAWSGVVLDCPWVKNRWFEGKAALLFFFFFLLCEFGDWLNLTQQQELLAELSLVLAEICQFPQYLCVCICSLHSQLLARDRLLASRSLSSEQYLLPLPTCSSQPTLCCSSH